MNNIDSYSLYLIVKNVEMIVEIGEDILFVLGFKRILSGRKRNVEFNFEIFTQSTFFQTGNFQAWGQCHLTAVEKFCKHAARRSKLGGCGSGGNFVLAAPGRVASASERK